MLKHTLCVLALLAVCASSLHAQGVPSAISYQGKLTDASGQPVPDGLQTITLNLYTAATGGTPVWTSPATPVTTHGGVFTTSFSPPATTFDTGGLWLETVVGGTALSPRTQLQSVPFAVLAASSDLAKTVPDGSISKVKLAADVVFMRAPYQTGVSSGFGGKLIVQVFIDGMLQKTATLAAPYNESFEVVRHNNGTNPLPQLTPGKLSWGSLVLRRPVSTDHTWMSWANSTLLGNTSYHDVQIRLMEGTSVLASWAFTHGWPSHYRLKLADDGLPVEELSFEFSGTPVRATTFRAYSVPVGSGLQLGFTSGQTAGTKYVLIATAAEYPDSLVVSDTGFGRAVVLSDYTTPGGVPVSNKLPGAASTDRITLRQNPSARGELFEWYYGMTQGDIVRKDISLLLTGGGQPTQTVMGGANAWPCSYTLKLADDGLPIEEFELVYETPQMP